MSRRITHRKFSDNFIKTKNCWVWKGAKMNGKGYGAFFGQIASRVSWELYRGKIPKGLHVLHSCDCPNCVNPKHLFLGTNKDNCQDKARKGRSYRPFGSLNPMYKKRPLGLNIKKRCSHCDRYFNALNYSRWHGDHCREAK